MVLSNKEWLNKMDEIIAAIQNASGDSQVIDDMLSNMWSSSITYNVGDYVLYNNKIWKCLVQNSNIIPTEGDTWTSVTITNEISTLNSNLTEILSTPIRQRFDLEKNANQFFTGIIWCSNNDLQNYPLVNGLLFSVVSGDVGFQIAIGYQNSGMYYRDITNSIYNSWVRIN